MDEKEPAPISSDLERALLCERLNWQVLPHELDDLEVERLARPLYELYVYRAYQAYGRDINSLDKSQAELVAWVEGLKERGVDG